MPGFWSRRSIVSAGLAASVSGACATRQAGQTDSVDVAIVGAGLSGLVAARTLRKAGMTHLRVLEARDRVGGRTINHDIGGGHVAEGGGQWVGPTQTAILGLCKQLGVGTFPTWLDGKVVYATSGARFEAPYEEEAPGPGSIFQRVDTLASAIPVEAPWSAPEAARLDAMTVAQWADQQQIGSEDRQALDRAAALTLGTTTDQLSMLYFLYYVRSAGSLHTLESMRGGAQDARIEGGSQILSVLMARELGEAVRLSTPVERIVQNSGGVEITSGDYTLRAKRAIIAMMPSDCDRIAFEPGLPTQRAALQSAWAKDGDALKVNVVYSSPFWRKKGLNGLAFSDDGPIQFTTDNSPPDGSLGVILILAGTSSLPSGQAERRNTILDSLARYFGEEARAPLAIHEMDWGKEKYTSHCVSGLRPGVLTRLGPALRPAVGRIHWAGTETATIWTGYMDGAVRAGEAAARDVLAAL